MNGWYHPWKFAIFKKAAWLIALVVLTAWALWLLANARGFQLAGELADRVATDKKQVALTFDDGPTPVYTDDLLAVLADHGIKATFFVTGAEVERYPEEAGKLVLAGHELGNHSWSHQRLVFKSQAFIRAEIERTDAAIRRAGFAGDILFRPPHGKKLLGLPWYLARTGRITVMWDVEPETDAGRIAADALERARPGSIILLHAMYGSREATRRALPHIIAGLQQRGFSLVTVSQLLKDSPPDI